MNMKYNNMLTESKLNKIIRNAINEATYQGNDIDKHFKQQQIDGAWKIKNKRQKDFNWKMSDKADKDENKNIRNSRHLGKQTLRDWDKADEERKKQVSESILNRIVKKSIKKVLNERNYYGKKYKGEYCVVSPDVGDYGQRLHRVVMDGTKEKCQEHINSLPSWMRNDFYIIPTEEIKPSNGYHIGDKYYDSDYYGTGEDDIDDLSDMMDSVGYTFP